MAPTQTSLYSLPLSTPAIPVSGSSGIEGLWLPQDLLKGSKGTGDTE